MPSRRILYIQFTNPAVYPPLQHSSHLLARRGWDVLFLGIRAVGTEAVFPESHPRILVKLLSGGGRGWRLKCHYVFFALWSLYWTWRWRPDWLYVSDPPGCPVASLIKLFSPVRILYHEHDSPNAHPGRRWMEFVYRHRRSISQSATLCILPNQHRMEIFQKEIKRHEGVFCVWNCPALSEISPPRESASDQKMTLLYQGSFVPQRLPLVVLEALAHLPSGVTLKAVGYETVGHPGYIAEYQRRATELKVSDRVTLSSGLLRTELVAMGSHCDVGLALQTHHENDINMMFILGASNKFYEYLGNGLALLISDTPGWQEAFVAPGYGISCDLNRLESLVEALQWLLNHPEERRAMGERGRRKILAEWNYERCFQPVLELLERNAA